ncbi:hypothetical protein H5410_030544 [Solanum commersonii]|uniref:Uncharacterized protein n=1 Tax=Solanum commersonii TaxID=4109 RepID=A0A9J5YJN2_SOLCO|nr:hypothetical protein H5410_030544 [Solanum commersonii]
MRKKKEGRRDCDFLWNKGVPFKENFFIWKIMRIPIVSGCWCCDTIVEEMAYIFLTATRLWNGMHIQHLIITWWNYDAPPKLQVIYRAMPKIIMWTLRKRRNKIKNGRNTTLTTMVLQIQDMIRKLVKLLYPWIRLKVRDWPDLITNIKEYNQKLYFYSVVWKPPEAEMDERGNLRYA